MIKKLLLFTLTLPLYANATNNTLTISKKTKPTAGKVRYKYTKQCPRCEGWFGGYVPHLTNIQAGLIAFSAHTKQCTKRPGK